VLINALLSIRGAWLKGPLANMTVRLGSECLTYVLPRVFLDSLDRLEASANALRAKLVWPIPYSSLLQLNRILQLSQVTKLHILCDRILNACMNWPVFGGARSL